MALSFRSTSSPMSFQGHLISMPFTWDNIPAYRLRREAVNAFLVELFGYMDFYTQVSKIPIILRQCKADIDAIA